MDHAIAMGSQSDDESRRHEQNFNYRTITGSVSKCAQTESNAGTYAEPLYKFTYVKCINR